jgi:DNA-binding MarR family transcriptional regulator
MITESTSELLREVARLHLKLQRTCVAACNDTSSTQCFILGELYRCGSLTLADLGRQLALDKGWVSRAVESLAQEGLLVKNSDPEDRRTILISLSKAGEKRYRELDQALNAKSEQIMNHLSETQREEINKSLGLLLEALQTEIMGDSSIKARKVVCPK